MFDITGPLILQQGDKLLFRADGLWGSSSDDDIVSHLVAKGVSGAVPDLVERVLQAAGAHSDKVTVLALEWKTPVAFEPTCDMPTRSISDDVFACSIQEGGLA